LEKVRHLVGDGITLLSKQEGKKKKKRRAWGKEKGGPPSSGGGAEGRVRSSLRFWKRASASNCLLHKEKVSKNKKNRSPYPPKEGEP